MGSKQFFEGYPGSNKGQGLYIIRDSWCNEILYEISCNSSISRVHKGHSWSWVESLSSFKHWYKFKQWKGPCIRSREKIKNGKIKETYALRVKSSFRFWLSNRTWLDMSSRTFYHLSLLIWNLFREEKQKRDAMSRCTKDLGKRNSESRKDGLSEKMVYQKRLTI